MTYNTGLEFRTWKYRGVCCGLQNCTIVGNDGDDAFDGVRHEAMVLQYVPEVEVVIVVITQ